MWKSIHDICLSNIIYKNFKSSEFNYVIKLVNYHKTFDTILNSSHKFDGPSIELWNANCCEWTY